MNQISKLINKRKLLRSESIKKLAATGKQIVERKRSPENGAVKM